MPTNTELLTSLREAKKDTSSSTARQKRSDTTYLNFLTDAQDFINRELELCKKESTLTLVAEDGNYDLASDFVAFPKDKLNRQSGLVYWNNGQLEPTTDAQLDAEQAGWRAASSGTPSKFYIFSEESSSTSKHTIRIHPKPSATFISSVATMTYHHVYRPADIAKNSNLPFDSNIQYKPFHRLLVLHAVANLELEDRNHEIHNKLWDKFIQKMQAASGWVPNVGKSKKGFKFDNRWRK